MVRIWLTAAQLLICAYLSADAGGLGTQAGRKRHLARQRVCRLGRPPPHVSADFLPTHAGGREPTLDVRATNGRYWRLRHHEPAPCDCNRTRARPLGVSLIFALCRHRGLRRRFDAGHRHRRQGRACGRPAPARRRGEMAEGMVLELTGACTVTCLHFPFAHSRHVGTAGTCCSRAGAIGSPHLTQKP